MVFGSEEAELSKFIFLGVNQKLCTQTTYLTYFVRNWITRKRQPHVFRLYKFDKNQMLLTHDF